MTSSHPSPSETAPGALSLRQNVLWTLAGNSIYAACQWGMLVSIAKLGTPVMVGQFSLGLAIAAPVYMLTNLHLRAVQATDVRREYAFGQYLGLRIIGSALAFVTILAIVVAAGYRRETTLVVLAVALAKAAESLSDILYGLWQSRERLDRISRAMMLRGVASLLALVAVLFLTRRIEWAVLALAAVWWASLLLYEKVVARSVLSGTSEPARPVLDVRRLRDLARVSFPLGVVMLLLSLKANIPRYLVEHWYGEARLGYFAAVAYVVVVGSTVVTALGQAAAPRFARHYLNDRGEFLRLLERMVALVSVLGLGGLLLAVAAGDWLLARLYAPDYSRYSDILSILVLAGCLDFLSASLGFAFTATRRFHEYTIPFLLNTSAGTLVGFLLVPAMGLRGAAFTALAFAAGQLLALALLLKRALARGPVPGAGTRDGRE